MSAAGVGVLAICEIELRLASRWTDELHELAGSARRRGIDWLARNYSVTTNPRAGAWHYYYLYGIERFGALAGAAQLGEHDWYGEGAAVLLEQQGKDGAWMNGADAIDSSFALLFLQRATQTGPRGPATGTGSANDSDAIARLASEGAGPVRIWIDEWNRRVVRELEWIDERGRGARVVRVEYWSGERMIGVALGDATRACNGARFAVEYVAAHAKPERVKARVVIASPSGERVVESLELQIDCERAQPSWRAELGEHLGPNLLARAKLEVDATSIAKGKQAPFGRAFEAELAVDGNAQTPWLADDDDKTRKLTVSLSKSVECDVIRVTPAVLAALGPTYLSRSIELEIELNGKHVHRLALDPDPLRPMKLTLDEPVAIKRLDIRILAVAPSKHCPLAGIGEIELFRR
jgi:hypothetical protein